MVIFISVGFPNYVFLKGLPTQITNIRAFDADKKPEDILEYSIQNNLPFYIDNFGDVYYEGSEDYLTETYNVSVGVDDGNEEHYVRLNFVIAPLQENKIIPLKARIALPSSAPRSTALQLLC